MEFDQKLLHSPIQALAYWIGYQQEKYRFYKLREIAIASELVCLLDANLSSKGWLVDCEVKLSDILNTSGSKKRQFIDFAIRKKMDKSDSKKSYSAMIELKRLQSGNTAFEKDIARISSIKKDINISGFIIACSPGVLLSEWINDNGYASRKIFKCGDSEYRIRRLVHASPYANRTIKKNSIPKGIFHVGIVEVLK